MHTNHLAMKRNYYSRLLNYTAKNKWVTFNQIGLPQLQHQCQTMCIQADQLHCLISIGSKQLNHVQWSAGLVLLRTLFNIETATVVTLSVESYLLFLQCRYMVGVHVDRERLCHPTLTRCLNRCPISETSANTAYGTRL